MLNFLREKLIATKTPDGQKIYRTLPGVMAGLAGEQVASFPALRPHQRHVWHAFLVQVAALALLKAGKDELPDAEEGWLDLICNLTPQWPGDEPWSLITDASQPAILQSPVPGGDLSGFKPIETPDALDMLVTSKNHDLKSGRMKNAAPEDWFFALLSLQTQEGIMGAGKYGISRMNGGYGSRSSLGLELQGSFGFRFRRDVTILLPAAPSYTKQDGIALLWLEPWNGVTPIAFADLSPLYVEICRRVRLTIASGRIAGMDAGSAAPRISGASELRGNTGDPWTPVSTDGKALTVSSEGFSYRKLSELLNPEKFQLPPGAKISGNDPAGGMVLVAQSICRGQGKTEGYHERRIPIPQRSLASIAASEDALAKLAEKRVNALGDLRFAFRLALFVLSQGAPDKIVADKETTKRFVEPWLQRLERELDRSFFEDLWEEAGADEAAREAIYINWLKKLRTLSRGLIAEAAQALPQPSTRRYRAQAQAYIAFRGRLGKSPPFNLLPEYQRLQPVNDLDGNRTNE
jgi:CRISPR system Cascade subunit CasA